MNENMNTNFEDLGKKVTDFYKSIDSIGKDVKEKHRKTKEKYTAAHNKLLSLELKMKLSETEHQTALKKLELFEQYSDGMSEEEKKQINSLKKSTNVLRLKSKKQFEIYRFERKKYNSQDFYENVYNLESKIKEVDYESDKLKKPFFDSLKNELVDKVYAQLITEIDTFVSSINTISDNLNVEERYTISENYAGFLGKIGDTNMYNNKVFYERFLNVLKHEVKDEELIKRVNDDMKLSDEQVSELRRTSMENLYNYYYDSLSNSRRENDLVKEAMHLAVLGTLYATVGGYNLAVRKITIGLDEMKNKDLSLSSKVDVIKNMYMLSYAQEKSKEKL